MGWNMAIECCEGFSENGAIQNLSVGSSKLSYRHPMFTRVHGGKCSRIRVSRMNTKFDGHRGPALRDRKYAPPDPRIAAHEAAVGADASVAAFSFGE